MEQSSNTHFRGVSGTLQRASTPSNKRAKISCISLSEMRKFLRAKVDYDLKKLPSSQ